MVLPLAPDDTATTLYRRVAEAHRVLIREAWPGLVAGTAVFTPQDEGLATYWPGRTPADGELRGTMTVAEMDRLVRATTTPYPGAFLETSEGRVRVWQGRISDPRETAPAGAFPVAAVDGIFLATTWAREPA